MIIEYKVEKSDNSEDYKVVEYINGIWENEYSNNWTLNEAMRVKRDLMATSHLHHLEL